MCTMPSRLSPLLLLIACCTTGSEDEPRSGAALDQPNVLIVISDDLASVATGTWGPGGEGLVPTPGIDALARRGVGGGGALVERRPRHPET